MRSKRIPKDRPDRLPIQILITYELDQKKVTMFCTNLSTGGLFVETLDLLPMGTKLKVNFTLPMEKKTFSLDSRVVWLKKSDETGPAGMGVEFEKSDDETTILLNRALAYFKKIIKG